MVSLYIASWVEGGGKTALCAGIGNKLHKEGKKVGYLKPLPDAELPTGSDKDCHFLHQVLRLQEPVESLCPPSDKLKQTYSEVAKDKDIVLIEGWGGLRDAKLAEASYQIADTLDSPVIIVVPFTNDLPWEGIASCGKRFAHRLLGIVINQAPRNKIESIHSQMTSMFNRQGVKVLGALPEERLLLGVSVGELAEHLKADILCCPQASTELIENVMIGALTPDSGADYFSRKPEKVVIARGERPDIQLAALATPIRCLILSGGVTPIPQVINWAEDKQVPILLAKQDTLSVATGVEQALLRTRFHHEKKLKKLEQILAQYFDFDLLYQSLGLKS